MPTKDVAKQTKCVIRKAKREKHFKKQERVNLVRQNIAEKLSQMKVAKKKKKKNVQICSRENISDLNINIF